jgi:iron-sulfur cluster assembly protein
MFTVTETAQKQIKEYFKDKEIKPIRVFLNQSGCCGPQLAMGLDDKRANDSVFKVDGVQYLIDKTLLVQAQPVSVDYVSNGFMVSSELKFDSGCSGCGSGGGSCS